MAALLRRFARSSRKRPSRISVVITPAASKYVSASRPPISTTVDQVQAESVPSEISVSMFAAPWRALASAARWKPRPLQKTTGVASANASHSQPENWSAGIIAEQDERRGQGDGDAEPAGERVVGVVVLVSGLVRVRAVARGGDRAARARPRSTQPGSKATLARSVAKLTVASTPSSLFSLRSIRAAHDAQVIPSRSSSVSLPPFGRGDGHARSAS